MKAREQLLAIAADIESRHALSASILRLIAEDVRVMAEGLQALAVAEEDQDHLTATPQQVADAMARVLGESRVGRWQDYARQLVDLDREGGEDSAETLAARLARSGSSGHIKVGADDRPTDAEFDAFRAAIASCRGHDCGQEGCASCETMRAYYERMDPEPEVECPSCGATIRARLADAPVSDDEVATLLASELVLHDNVHAIRAMQIAERQVSVLRQIGVLGSAPMQLRVVESEPDQSWDTWRALAEFEQAERVAEGNATDEEVARIFHEVYERLAPQFGYRTRESSAKPWHEVPEANKALMVATVHEVRLLLSEEL